MFFEHETKTIEKLHRRGNLLYTPYPEEEISKSVLGAHKVYMSPMVRAQLSLYKGSIMWSLIAVLLVIHIVYSAWLFFTKVVWYLHDGAKDGGFVILAHDEETDEVQKLVLRPMDWIIAKNYILFRGLTFFQYPPPIIDNDGDGEEDDVQTTDFGFDR